MGTAVERDPEEALRGLLSAWRERRRPELAARIEALSARLGGERPDPDGKRVKDKVARWGELAKAANSADFEPLARTLFLTTGGADVGERLLALAEWPPDPRLATVLHDLALRVAYTASSARPFYKALFLALTRVADPRTLDALPAIEAKFAETFAQREDYAGYLARQCAKLRAAIEAAGPPGELTDADRAAIAQVDAWLARPEAPQEPALPLDALFDLVYDDPDADEPRMVLADALQQAGDPRGELIALQLLPEPAKEHTKRIKQLLDAHADEWVGPLSSWTLKKGRVFERGFLARCTYGKAKGTGDVEPPVTRAWSTVREIDAELLPGSLVRQMPRVRQVGGLALADLPAIGHGEPLPSLVALRARGQWAPGLVEAMGTLPALPALERLRIQVIGTVQAAPALGEVAALARALARVSVLRIDVPPFEEVRLEGPPEGRVVMTLSFNNAGWRPEPERALAAVGQLAASVPGLAAIHLVVYDYRGPMQAKLLDRFPLDALRAAAGGVPVTRSAEIRPSSWYATWEREI